MPRERTAGPTGPGRRDHIVEVAANLARSKGLSSITMRSVAEAANVPLGSMTYHFVNKDELIRELIRYARAKTDSVTRSLLPELVESVGLQLAIATVVETLTNNDRDELIFEMDMYLLAMHNPEFVDESKLWITQLIQLLTHYTDKTTAKTLSYVIDGICSESAVTGAVFDKAELMEILSPILK